MNLRPLLLNIKSKKFIAIILLLSIAILSITLFSKIATSPETYKVTIRSIDDKKVTVMGITATAAVMSTALSAIPGDATTPIANQIMELSSYLLIVVSALVLEKLLLTLIGYISFNILIPISCVLLGVNVFVKKEKLKILAIKLIAVALVIVFVIPFSMKISDMLYEANQSTVEQVTTEFEKSIQEEEKEKSWVDKIIDKVTESVTEIGERAKQILNSFIDAIALFIIVYCVIPILIVFAVILLINILFKVNIPNFSFKNIFKK